MMNFFDAALKNKQFQKNTYDKHKNEVIFINNEKN